MMIDIDAINRCAASVDRETTYVLRRILADVANSASDEITVRAAAHHIARLDALVHDYITITSPPFAARRARLALKTAVVEAVDFLRHVHAVASRSTTDGQAARA